MINFNFRQFIVIIESSQQPFASQRNTSRLLDLFPSSCTYATRSHINAIFNKHFHNVHLCFCESSHMIHRMCSVRIMYSFELHYKQMHCFLLQNTFRCCLAVHWDAFGRTFEFLSKHFLPRSDFPQTTLFSTYTSAFLKASLSLDFRQMLEIF